MGMDDDQSKAYQAELCKEDLKEPGDDDVVNRVMADFTAKGVDLDEDTVRQQLASCWQDAIAADG